MDLGLLIFLIIIGVAILIFLTIFIARRAKGKITINLEKYEFSPGEKINGTITLNLRKPLNANSLKVGLKAIYKTTDHSNTNDRGVRDRSSTIFEFEKPISGQKQYPAGETNYDFELTIPKDIDKRPELKGFIGAIARSVQYLSNIYTQLNWYITSNLDMPGLNILKKIQINII